MISRKQHRQNESNSNNNNSMWYISNDQRKILMWCIASCQQPDAEDLKTTSNQKQTFKSRVPNDIYLFELAIQVIRFN